MNVFFSAVGCGYGWHKFMSSCYDFQLRLKKTWYDAKVILTVLFLFMLVKV